MDSSASVFNSALSVDVKLDRARTELLDLSARNRLLNVPRSSKTAKTIEIFEERSEEVFRLLVRDGRNFTFVPRHEKASSDKGSEVTPDDEDGLTELPQPEEDEKVEDRGVARRHSDTRLQTRMTSNGLQKRLLDLYNDARTTEEEQGVNILFLALGTLKWIDPQNAANIRYAPLLLVPVTLERGSAGKRFKLKARQEDFASNLSLEAYLDRVHALKLPAFEATEEFSLPHYMQSVVETVAIKNDWEVRPNDIVLGFFSFAKFLMYRDLDPETWPVEARITTQPLVRALLTKGFAPSPESVPEGARIDDHIQPDAMTHIMDCDSSQTLAVHDVRSGRDLVIQGPPGTGKSQTIANIIAAAVADGKSVLFVAEKMAALDVVKRRLDQSGVGDACLELHSNKVSKRSVLDELRRTWQLGSPCGRLSGALLHRLTEARDYLNAHADRMHRQHPQAELVPYQVFGQLVRLRRAGQRPTDFSLNQAVHWSNNDREQRADLLAELAERITEIGRPDDHPWCGIGLESVIPTMIDRLVPRLDELGRALADWRTSEASLARCVEMQTAGSFAEAETAKVLARRVASAPTLDAAALCHAVWQTSGHEIDRLLKAGRAYKRGKQRLATLTRESAPDTDIEPIIKSLSVLPPGFSAAAFQRVHNLTELLPRITAEVARLADELGVASGADNLVAIEQMCTLAERVAAAPDASPEAFSAVVWERGVEQADDLAKAVVTLEEARREIGAFVTDHAWTTELSSVRQALATHTGFFRKLNADWRRAMAIVRTVLRDHTIPVHEVLARLDILLKGQTAMRAMTEGDAFGRAAFAEDWRGERTASAPLLALVAWMRTLRGLGAEPRLIAARLSDRPALGYRSAAVRQLTAEAAKLLAELWTDLDNTVAAAFYDAPAPDRASLAGLVKWLAPVAIAHSASSAALTGEPTVPERIDRLRKIAAWQRAAATLSEGAELGRAAFGAAWSGIVSDWPALTAAARWIVENADIRMLAARVDSRAELTIIVEAVADGQTKLQANLETLFADLRTSSSILFAAPMMGTSLETIAQRLATWINSAEQLSKWIAYRVRADRARELELSPLVDRLQDGRAAPCDLVPAFHMACLEAILNDMIRLDPELGRFDGTLHAKRALEFADLDRKRILAAAVEVVTAHHRGMPSPSGVGPIGILQAEIARRRGHMAIRKLMLNAAPAIQALKPVMMMSPLSVAQFLTPGRMSFDLLVMDEASQIQPVDALGAIARCRQVVVVGDERQLPPTRFFSKMTGAQPEVDDDEGAGVADIESILGLFVARGLPQRMLRWHYRSRHQSLIAVSNRAFYESRLFIVPSPYTGEMGMGLMFRHVPQGIFDSGGTGTNAIEAKVVAQEVIRHARTQPQHSLGVATFSAAQRRAIQDELELLRRLSPDTEAFFHAHSGEPFFVKNLENVQGDERDVIMISVGYGKSSQGRMLMNFGPLSSDGGERRLNVLISRAKHRCEVFASITDEDIDLERAKSKGVFAFKLFLRYARTGQLDVARLSTRPMDSVFEEQVADALQALGYQVHPQVGMAGFFIDLAIADAERPGRYLLGIECDGAAYHSSQSARDRDRLRQSVLEDHGWIIHRIWSSDWFQRPQEQLERVVAAIAAAKSKLDDQLERCVHEIGAVPVEIVPIKRKGVTEIGPYDVSAAYQEANLNSTPGAELHNVPTGQLAELTVQVVTAEGPVHKNEIVARIRTAWKLQRAGGRIQAAVESAIEFAVKFRGIERDGDFLSVPGAPVRVRDRNEASASLRLPERLPPSEIDAALVAVIRGGMGAKSDQAVIGASRMLGIKATSAQIRETIEAGIERLRAKGDIVEQHDMLVEVGRE